MLKITDKVYTIEELKAIVKPILEKCPRVKAFYVYSDYAYGTATSDSPILCIIEGENLTVRDITMSEMADELDEQLQKEVVIYQESELLYRRRMAIRKERVLIYGRS